MRIEAFSEGKNQDDPDANEDQLLILPGRGYAVIDGVTDITGRVFDGMRTGRLASRIVQRAAAEFLTDPAAGPCDQRRFVVELHPVLLRLSARSG